MSAKVRGSSAFWDAEDAPAPDQIAAGGPRHFLRCAKRSGLGAGGTGLLQRRPPTGSPAAFTIEYASWFRLILPGMRAAGLVRCRWAAPRCSCRRDALLKSRGLGRPQRDRGRRSGHPPGAVWLPHRMYCPAPLKKRPIAAPGPGCGSDPAGSRGIWPPIWCTCVNRSDCSAIWGHGNSLVSSLASWAPRCRSSF